eukprot:1662298-Pyramimonas_sp.AAC.1
MCPAVSATAAAEGTSQCHRCIIVAITTLRVGGWDACKSMGCVGSRVKIKRATWIAPRRLNHIVRTPCLEPPMLHYADSTELIAHRMISLF